MDSLFFWMKSTLGGFSDYKLLIFHSSIFLHASGFVIFIFNYCKEDLANLTRMQ
jgi:hypothetical protein